MMLARRHKNSPRPAWKIADAFAKWVRGWDCACEGRNPYCSGKTVAAHVDYAGKGTPDAKGMGTKAADRWLVPFSVICHKMQHDLGWPEFERRFLGGEGSAEKLAARLWQLWPGRRAWEAKHA